MPPRVLNPWRVALVMAVTAVAVVAGLDQRKQDSAETTSLIAGLRDGAEAADLSHIVARLDARVTSYNQTLNFVTLEAQPGRAQATRAALTQHPHVRYVEPDRALYFAAGPNDEQYANGQQWNIDRVRAVEAWPLLPPGGNTVVAVLDTGLDYDHPEFAGRISSFGCDQFTGKCSQSGSTTRPVDIDGHGTHVGGIIAANTGNRTGIASVSSGRVTLMPIKVSAKGGGAVSDSAAVDAIVYAVDKGAKVINMSFGGPCGDEPTQAWRDALAYADARDVLLVMAAGNTGPCPDGRYPHSDPRVIAVAATDRVDAPATFTAQGRWVGVAAPGVRILSTYPMRDGAYATISGTSMAAPHVTAQAALLFQVPGGTKAKVMEWIKSTCDPVPQIFVQCGGRINVYRSVHLAVNGVDPAKVPPPAVDAPVSAAPSPAAGRFNAPALPQGFAASGSTRAAQMPPTSPGNAANVAWNGAFWLSAPNVPVGLCNVEDAATIAAATTAFNRLADATARGLGWQVVRDDAVCDPSFTQPKLVVTRDNFPDDASAARTSVKDITGAPCDVGAGTGGCWVSAGAIMLNAPAFDRVSEEQQAFTVLREIVRALGLSHSTACTDSLLISTDRCPDTTPTDLGADDIASLNELLAAALKALNG